LKRPLIREDLNVIQISVPGGWYTFITSDGTSPYNPPRRWTLETDNNKK